MRELTKRDGKLGVFWHTQGSGKTYSMVFFVPAVRRLLGGQFTFVVVTDRLDLDAQLYGTFAGCGLATTTQTGCRAATALAGSHASWSPQMIVFTLVQRFNQPVPDP